MRQFGIHLEGFCPEPRGDWGWMLRKCRDVAVRAVRQLMKVYGGGDIEEKYTVVRLLLEEAFHRMLMGFEGELIIINLPGLIATATQNNYLCSY